MPYKSKKSDELTLELNDQLVITRKGGDKDQRWFAKSKKTGKEGFVPRSVLAVSEPNSIFVFDRFEKSWFCSFTAASMHFAKTVYRLAEI